MQAWSPAGRRRSTIRRDNGGGSCRCHLHQARHDNTFGNCHGRLIVSPEQLSYESVTEVDHSRRWEYRGIREISLPNPYELEVKPASGGTYKLFLEGSGMDPAVFRSIVDRVTAGRSGP
jgi:hypothetical protein